MLVAAIGTLGGLAMAATVAATTSAALPHLLVSALAHSTPHASSTPHPAFDVVFTGAGISVIRTPVRAPRANAIAERFIGTLRREGLDHILITGPRHLDRVLTEYVQHYNVHRPHRSLHQHPPVGDTRRPTGPPIRVLRRDRLGGLLHEYVQVA